MIELLIGILVIAVVVGIIYGIVKLDEKTKLITKLGEFMQILFCIAVAVGLCLGVGHCTVGGYNKFKEIQAKGKKTQISESDIKEY